MIEGVHIDVKADELIGLIADRSIYHTKKADAYRERITALAEAGIKEDKNVSGDPMRGLMDKEQSHLEKVSFFDFLGEHIIPDETYRLSMNDLRTIEVISRWL